MHIVRNMLEEDITKCANIFVEVYNEVYSEPWTTESGEKRTKELYSHSKELCFVLEIDCEIRGFLTAKGYSWYDGLRIYIEEIVIQKKLRGQGYGTLLLNSLEKRGNEKRAVGYSLVAEKDSHAYKYYLSKGFLVSHWVHLERIQHII
jgi:aminoglycoside 6'-N-acetyltransferase I